MLNVMFYDDKCTLIFVKLQYAYLTKLSEI